MELNIKSKINNDEDREYMANLYVNYYTLMRKHVLQILRDTEQVDDVIIETCIKLINKISLLRTFKNDILSSYITYAARNSAIDFIKHRDAASKWLFYGLENDLIALLPDNRKIPEELLLEKENLYELYKVLDKLSQKDRNILEFKYFFKMTDKKIGEIFDIKQDSVREYLSRARKKAYKLLGEEKF